MFGTYEEKREQARGGRGIAALVSWLHLVANWLRSRAFQLRDASAKQTSADDAVDAVDVAFCPSLSQPTTSEAPTGCKAGLAGGLGGAEGR
jgi:hypothetical protein